MVGAVLLHNAFVFCLQNNAFSEWAMLGSNQRPLPCEGAQACSSPSYCVRELRRFAGILRSLPCRSVLPNKTGSRPAACSLNHGPSSLAIDSSLSSRSWGGGPSRSVTPRRAPRKRAARSTASTSPSRRASIGFLSPSRPLCRRKKEALIHAASTPKLPRTTSNPGSTPPRLRSSNCQTGAQGYPRAPCSRSWRRSRSAPVASPASASGDRSTQDGRG